MSDRLLTTSGAAKYLHVSEASVRRWTDAGLLPVGRVGVRKARRFKEADLARFMESRDRGPAKTSIAPMTIVLRGRAIPVGAHLAGFYGSESGRMHQALPFLLDGLSDEQPCLLFATPALHDDYARALRQARVDLQAAGESGAFSTLTVPRMSPEAWIAHVESRLTQILRGRSGPIRFAAEVTAGLKSTGSHKGVLLQEHLVTSLAKRFPVVILCLYDVREFDGPMILEALKLHTDTFDHGFGYFLS
jgi:excisionase family DNA binding protein